MLAASLSPRGDGGNVCTSVDAEFWDFVPKCPNPGASASGPTDSGSGVMVLTRYPVDLVSVPSLNYQFFNKGKGSELYII